MKITNRKARKLLECSERTAARRMALCRDALGKQRFQILSVKEFCKYYDIANEDLESVGLRR